MALFDPIRRAHRDHKIYGLILDAVGNLADEYNYIIGVTDHISLIQGRKKLRFSDVIETVNIAAQNKLSDDEEYLLAIRRFEALAFSIKNHTITAPEALSVMRGCYKTPKGNVETHVVEIINDIEKVVGLQSAGDSEDETVVTSNPHGTYVGKEWQEGIGVDNSQSVASQILRNAKLGSQNGIAQSSTNKSATDWKGWSYKNPKGTRLQP